jgi:hypothetical protein
MHFFSKLLNTVGLLFSKPGFLSSEYKRGNRTAYLSPLLLYLFITGLFFVVFYAGFRNQTISFGEPSGKKFVKKSTLRLLKKGYENAKNRKDSAEIEKAIRALEDSARIDNGDDDNEDMPLEIFGSSDTTYKTIAAYDSAQQLLPAEKKDGRYAKEWKRRGIILNERYRSNSSQFWLDISNKFVHYFPYLIFVLLPVYALFFKLVYMRRRRFTFSDHCVFLEHNYTFLFILMLLYLGVLALRQYTNEERLIITAMVILTAGCIYACRAMKKFYEQGWGKTILKFILLNILCISVLVAAFMISFIVSVSGY